MAQELGLYQFSPPAGAPHHDGTLPKPGDGLTVL